MLFNDDWYFHLGEIENGQDPHLDHDMWQEISLPHDWSVDSLFKKHRIENWDISGNLDHRIGYLAQGIGWYRKEFTIPESEKGQKIFIQFEGIYRNSTVWLNGQKIGFRPYGYSTFSYDLTPYLQFGRSNLLAVHVDNTGVSSRWYSGSGIYRKVTLIITSSIHVDEWGTYWTSPEILKDSAKVHLRTWIVNDSQKSNVNAELIAEIWQMDTCIAQFSAPIALIMGKSEWSQELIIKNPSLWSPIAPNLYKIKTIIKSGENILDEYWTPLGIRYFRFDPDNGFFLNDQPLKFNGVCLHHDNGCLGAVEHIRAVERKLEILKKMGCNAIRTSHNPPSRELIELCDAMGFMVMDEAFDEWIFSKTPMGYWRHFNEWYERDVRDFVWRDRNHPSIIIWSCGNEVHEQSTPEGVEIAKKLVEIFHQEDPTRPVTQGCNNPAEANRTGFSEVLDVMGYNYYGDAVISMQDKGFLCRYDTEHKTYPKRILIGSENVSALITRGIYHFPTVINSQDPRDDFHCNAYDWKSDITLIIAKTRPYVCGSFTWEGIDYIGEPTPYNWPTRSSQYGIIDLAGFPKDTYYLYQSMWTDQPMVHIVPQNWNWQPGMQVPVWVYTNCETAELFLNGKSLGEKDFEYDDVAKIMWEEVAWEPGELKAVAKKGGRPIIESSIKTAEWPDHVEIIADRNKISPKGDLIYITAKICDRNGVMVPDASNLVSFQILEGPGKIIGVDNGNPMSHEPFVDEQRHAFSGLCLCVIQTVNKEGTIMLRASSSHLKSSTLRIEVQNSK
jgi:beta-galactosidase